MTLFEALKIETLQQLAEGANQDIRIAAIKIITERATQGPTFELLLQDIAGADPGRRNRALKALKYLIKIAGRDTYGNYATYKALIDCLCRFLDDKEAYPPTFNLETNQAHRSEGEQDAMFILCVACQMKPADAFKAGLVTRWLAKYPFGGFKSSESEKRAIVQRVKSPVTESDDLNMSEILRFLDKEPEGRRQLRSHGLLDSAIGESPDGEEDKEILVFGVEDGSATGVTVGAQRGRRVREDSLEEQALRRRRREAMVLHEGTSPLSRSDIIQREDTSSEQSLDTAPDEQTFTSPESGNRSWIWWPWGQPPGSS